MSDIKWIKITTSMFEDEKIDFIESLPEGDAILVIWLKLLTLAGKINDKGLIYLTESIAYTEDMLAHKFKKPITTVKLALTTFKNLDMVEELDDGSIYISNWDKHQNITGMEKVREQNRLRKQQQRDRDRLEADKELKALSVTSSVRDSDKSQSMSRDSHVTSQQSHATDIDIDKDIDKDIDTDLDDRLISFINKLKQITGKQFVPSMTTKSEYRLLFAEFGEKSLYKALDNVYKSEYLKVNITLDWLLKKENFINVFNGKYKDFKQPTKGSQVNKNYNMTDDELNAAAKKAANNKRRTSD